MSSTAENTTELTIAERAAQAMSVDYTEKQLNILAKKNADVTEIKDGDDYELVKRAGIELKKVRVSIENSGKAARDDANKFAKAVIAEQDRLTGIISPEENRLKALRKEADDEAERKATEAREAEEARIKGILAEIEGIKQVAGVQPYEDAVAIQAHIHAVESVDVSRFAEYAEQAYEACRGTIATLEQALSARKEFESRQAEQERVAKEQADRQAALDRQAEEQRKEQEAIDQRNREAEEQRLAGERAETERLRKENERLENESREKAETERRRLDAEAEEARQEALRPDKDRLIDWLNKLRFVDGVSLDNLSLRDIQVDALQELDGLAKKYVQQIEAL